MKITEKELKQIVVESINKILKEGANNVYTMEDWSRDTSLNPQIGQYIDDDVIYELAGSVPPTTYSRGIFQPGEAYTVAKDYETELYMTFVNKGEWQYIGLCPAGSTKRMLSIDDDEYLGESIIREDAENNTIHKGELHLPKGRCFLD